MDFTVDVLLDLQAIKLNLAQNHAGTPEGEAYRAEAERYGAIAAHIQSLNDEIARLKAHQDESRPALMATAQKLFEQYMGHGETRRLLSVRRLAGGDYALQFSTQLNGNDAPQSDSSIVLSEETFRRTFALLSVFMAKGNDHENGFFNVTSLDLS